MSSETSSTARTSPRAFPPNGDSPCGKTFVRLRTSRSAKLRCEQYPAPTREYRVRNLRRRLTRRDHRHSRQGGQQADELPATEVFFQNEARQQHGHSRVERCNDDGFVQPTALAGKDEQRAGSDVEESGHHPECGARTIKLQRGTGRYYRDGGRRERSNARDGSDPHRRTARLMDAKIKARKPHARERSHAHTSRPPRRVLIA